MRQKKILFKKKMDELNKSLLHMGGLVEEAIAKSIESLKRQDTELAAAIIKEDDLIDNLGIDIEDRCLELIATQQPMAKDLRSVATFFKLVVDLERMADYAVSIARIVCRIGQDPLIKPLVDIPRISLITQKMVKEALDAYVYEDVELALQMMGEDDEVDKLHEQIFRELLTIMMEKPGTISQASHLLFVSRYLERIADHAVNIGEEVVFLVTGSRKKRIHPE